MIICFEGMIDVCQSSWVFQARTLHTGFIIVSISCFTACVLCQCVSAYVNGEKVRESVFFLLLLLRIEYIHVYMSVHRMTMKLEVLSTM